MIFFKDLIENNRDKVSDIFDFKINEDNSIVLDFSANNSELTEEVICNSSKQEEYVNRILSENGKIVGVGGYNEERVIYQRGHLFSGEDPRYIHFGLDLWTASGTKVHAPIEGEIYSLKNNEGSGDYGPTIILKHKLEDTVFYSLYGHLDLISLEKFSVGETVKMGEHFCNIGSYPTNGDWAPHLHFQILTDLQDFKDGDYPAVSDDKNRDKFLRLCPNPNTILGISTLSIQQVFDMRDK